MRSRATAGLASLAGLALLAVFAVAPGASEANTRAVDVGTASAPDQKIVVNVQEPLTSTAGAAGIMELDTESSDGWTGVDWFHLTGVPCSFPRQPTKAEKDDPSTQAFSFCADNYLGGVAEARKPGSLRALTWNNLATVAEPKVSDYTGVYQVDGLPVYMRLHVADATTAWTNGDMIGGSGNSASPGKAASNSNGDYYTQLGLAAAGISTGVTLGGAFYLPSASGLAPNKTAKRDADEHAGFELIADGQPLGQTGDRTLRFIAGAYGARASVTITTSAIGSGSDPDPLPVPLYPATITAGSAGSPDERLTQLYTVIIPAGVTVHIRFEIEEVYLESGHVMLAAANLAEGADYDDEGVDHEHLTYWQGCSDTPWLQLLTYPSTSDDMAIAPYFQQFQLRAAYNAYVAAGSPQYGDVVERLRAAFCEAFWWSDTYKDGNVPSHLKQNGYGMDNTPAPPVSETDELTRGAITQPMAEMAKRAFVCENTPATVSVTLHTNEPAVNMIPPDQLLNETAADCTEIQAGDRLDSGTTVYWLYTITNVAYFGYVYAEDDPAYSQLETPITVTDDLGGGGQTDTCQAAFWTYPAVEDVSTPPLPSYISGYNASNYAIAPPGTPAGTANTHFRINQRSCVIEGTVQ
ncbi:MAG: hypothetical protein LBE08_10770 [Bifidobacteriaceae bacterium]|jgi:hypothetical protein|nr:hypothetical protein [Bifidobacteriaceae bacterium]